MMNDLELLFRFDRIRQLWITILYHAQATILMFFTFDLDDCYVLNYRSTRAMRNQIVQKLDWQLSEFCEIALS